MEKMRGYEERKAAELVALMYSPKLSEPLKTKLGEAALRIIREVVEDLRPAPPSTPGTP